MQVENVQIDARGTKTTVIAVCDEVFAIHPTLRADWTWEQGGPRFYVDRYSLTHRPTGLAVTGGMSWALCLRLLEEIQRRGLDFNVPTKEAAQPLKAGVDAILADIT
jgi:hypothetical protein